MSRRDTPPAVYAALAAWTLAMLALVWLKVSPLTFVDPDVWHQMSLAREIWRTGEISPVDVFSYTPTVRPLVHHEWGAGLVWLAVATFGGASAFLSLKYALVVGVLSVSVWAARRRGASVVTLVALALPAILLAHYAFTTIRPQLLTMLALALLLLVLSVESPRRGRWLVAWLPVQLLWINVHAGFVVGLGFLGLTVIERAVRGERPFGLAAVTLVAAALTLINPWGSAYPHYLAEALFMERPSVPEWAPLWRDLRLRWLDLLLWMGMVSVAGYSLRARGLRACRGVGLVVVSAAFALLHQRNVALFAVTWFVVVAPWFAGTPLADRLRARVVSRPGTVAGIGAVAFALWSVGGALLQPWTLRVPADAATLSLGQPVYPVGAVDYLAETGFQGNLMTPFVEGAYVMWRLHPQGVRVSYDGRYEAAYQPQVVAHHDAFYSGGPGWRRALDAYATDVVLVPRHAPVVRPMVATSGWSVVYGDDMYILVARSGLSLPFTDHRGQTPHGSFP